MVVLNNAELHKKAFLTISIGYRKMPFCSVLTKDSSELSQRKRNSLILCENDSSTQKDCHITFLRGTLKMAEKHSIASTFDLRSNQLCNR